MVTGVMPDDQQPGGPRARPGIRRELAAIFARLLDRDEVPFDVDFADLGGDSIQLLGLLLEIEERFGLSLTPPQFAAHGSVEALAALIRARRAPARLVTVQKGRGVPLFLAHSVSGVTPYAGWLAELLGPEQGLQLMHWRRPPEGVTPTLEEHAAGHVATIRRAFPEGPYDVLGHSFGALLAYEVARQLVEDGAEVRFLGLIDRGPELNDRRVGVALQPVPPRKAHAICTRMMNGYVPQPYRGDLWLFRAVTLGEGELLAPAMGWGDLVLGRVHEIQGEGTHGGMMSRDLLARWAPALRRAIDGAASGPLRDAPPTGVPQGLAGLRAARRGDRPAEIAAYRAALSESAEAPFWVWRNLAAALLEEGDAEGARDALEGAVRREAVPINACMELVALLQRHRPAEVPRWAALAREVGDGSVPAEIALGRLDLALGDKASAERRFRRVLEACPEHERIARRLQAMMTKQGRLAEALEMARHVARLLPGEAGPLIEVARLADRCGDAATRISAARAALALKPDDEEAWRLAAA